MNKRIDLEPKFDIHLLGKFLDRPEQTIIKKQQVEFIYFSVVGRAAVEFSV